ncbi:urea ABC transporter, permease protein UrtC [Meiothermus luteus]|uniref:Urea ABC transporter, permease protein UrtC n=1 Tax=Meiothermus luteus TaxID=2026184 RepID=A0A399EWJ2_9DEIN|nr:branched-chain amino acid ABC transporter permease [Meiothermus luteus]RIH88398.1 urea ABC transporter, permease protein UrtC [Meiothermus luteus]RMH54858.1 MAG: branched-chain amino acid ABC transporter permease [Deinococcota bacterium]
MNGYVFPFTLAFTALSVVGALLRPASDLVNLALLASVALVSLGRMSTAWRSGLLAVLALTLTLLLRLNPGDKLAFYGLLGVLIACFLLPNLSTLVRVALGAAILFISVPIAGLTNSFLFELGIQIGIFAALALGLNVVVGQAGLLDLGFAAFFAIGAYTWGIFGSPQAAQFIEGFPPGGLPGNYLYLFMALAIITAAITGVLIGLPALRLRGDYLAIVTLGLGEVVRVFANNLDKPLNITNGPQGITPVNRPEVGFLTQFLQAIGAEQVYGKPIDSYITYAFFFYLLVLLVIGVVILVNIRLANSRFGRAWVAIREDEIAAKAMGIPLLPTKLLAFATGAAFSGIMGAIFAAKQTFVSPESFTLQASINILAFVILGGMGSIGGAVVGAAAVTVLNIGLLKDFSDLLNTWRQTGVTILGYNMANLPPQLNPAKYERLVFGVILILMMIFRPEGLIPEQRHRVEMQEARQEAKEGGGK